MAMPSKKTLLIIFDLKLLVTNFLSRAVKLFVESLSLDFSNKIMYG